MILTDCHVHSCFSSDSETPVEAMIEQALARNFSYFYLTDHMDYEFPVQEEGMDFLFDPDEYFSTLEKWKEKYSGEANPTGKIEIRPSIELGLKPHLGDEYRKLLKSYPFDFVIGSTHLVDDLDPYNQAFWADRPEKESLEAYFEAVIENIRSFPEFDSCGHLDYAIRYAPSTKYALAQAAAARNNSETSKSFGTVKNSGTAGNPGKAVLSGTGCLIRYRYGDYADYLDEALKLLIHNGIALEVNTAGYAKGLGQPNPQPEVLKRYRELGGELLTVGSDGHVPEAYAFGFMQAEELLKAIGFKYYTVFKQRKPVMLPF